jgi:hypothetical protein
MEMAVFGADRCSSIRRIRLPFVALVLTLTGALLSSAPALASISITE